MNFNGEELMLMMLYNPGTRLGLMQELRLMQCYLLPDETALNFRSNNRCRRRAAYIKSFMSFNIMV